MTRNGTVERMHIAVNGLRIWAKVDGPEGGEPVVLIPPARETSIRWSIDLVDGLVNDGFQVVRFDNRDSGRSDPVEAAYGLDDMAEDVRALLDELALGPAHVLGVSMGAMIAQRLAFTHADAVASLTLISSTPGPDAALPGPHDDLLAELAPLLMRPMPSVPAKRVEFIVDGYRVRNGTRFPFEEERETMLTAVEIEDFWVDHHRHAEAIFAEASVREQLSKIEAPTLIVHGGLDHVYQTEHAVAIATAIPNALLWFVDGLGHEFPEALVPSLLDRLRPHLHNAGTAAQ